MIILVFGHHVNQIAIVLIMHAVLPILLYLKLIELQKEAVNQAEAYIKTNIFVTHQNGILIKTFQHINQKLKTFLI